MASQPEPVVPIFPELIYLLEKTDPVLGGPYNEATGEGIDNLPLMQLAQRTGWLKAMLDATGLGTIATLVDNVRDLKKTNIYQFSVGAVGSPFNLQPGALFHVEGAGDKAYQLAMLADGRMFHRHRADATIASWSSWVALIDASGGNVDLLSIGGKIESVSHAKAQINGFLRSGALLIYAHQNDDAVDPIIPGSVKGLMNRGADSRLTWGGSPVWTDDAGGRSLPGMSGATWWRAPDGLIIQAAWPSAADGQTITFPITFPNACNAVMLTENHPTAVLSICAQNVTPSGFTFRAHNTVTNVTHSGATQHMMLAIGH